MGKGLFKCIDKDVNYVEKEFFSVKSVPFFNISEVSAYIFNILL